MGYLIPDWVLKIAGSFDWYTPLANEAQDYKTLEFSGDYNSALAHKIELEKQGIPCRLEGGGLFTNACVYTKKQK